MKKLANYLWKKKIAILVVFLLLGGGYYGYNKFFGEKKETQQIKTATVKKGDIKITVTGSGQIYAKNQVDLKPQVAGDGLDVIEVKVKNDQEVKRGDIIAVLDSTEAQEKIQTAQLQLRNAQLKMKQTEAEYKTKTYDDKLARQLQENALAQQQIELNNAYKDLADYTIKAPFDGIITGLSVDVGDSISRDEILASVITQELYAEVTLNEVDAVKVTQGKKAELTFNALEGEILKGEVSKIETIGTVEQGVVSYTAEIDFENSSQYLKPGMSVEAEIEIESKENILKIPSSAIKENNGKKFVMVVDTSLENLETIKTDMQERKNINNNDTNQNQGPSNNRMFQRKEVETGISDDVYTEIISGLNEGEKIITANIQTSTSNNNKDISSGKTNSFMPGMGSGMRMR